jgi:inner membrane protein involved in colicin E2 resistance
MSAKTRCATRSMRGSTGRASSLGMIAAFMMSTLQKDGSLLLVGSGLSVFFVAIGLPTLWLAWSLPDEPDAG